MKRAARRAVAIAVRSGALVRAETCERCERGGRIEGHHADYSRPLDVEWLCSRCHRHEHDPRLAGHTEESVVLTARLYRPRRLMLEAIAAEQGHPDLTTTLREAVDMYIEKYLREKGLAA